MKSPAIMLAALACAACSGTPMVTSVDLTKSSAPVLMTYGVGVTEIELRQQPYGGTTELPEACKAALDAYEVARSAHDAAAVPYARSTGTVLEVLAYAWGGGTPRRLSTAEKKAILADLKALSVEGDAVVALADKARLGARLVGERCPEERNRIEVLSHVRTADGLIYGVNLSGGAMSNDALKLVTGADGLPTSVVATADDQTAAAVTSVARLIGRFAAPGLDGGGLEGLDFSQLVGFGDLKDGDAGDALAALGSDTAAHRCGISAMPAKRRLAEMERRPACADAASLILLAADLVHEPDELPSLRPERPDRPAWHSLSELEAGVRYAGTTVRVRCAVPLPRTPAVVENGLVVATPTPCLLTASEDGREVARFSFVGLSERHLTVVPIERAALVKNATTLTLQNGMVTSVDVNRPSTGAALAGLPGQVINGLVSGVTDAFRDSEAIETARVSQMRAETSRIEAEAARIAQPTPAWTDADTAYVSALGVVATRQSTHDAALAAEEPDPAAIATAAAELRNAKALANAAAVAAERPLPYPDLI